MGIGRATALTLARDGYDVAVHYHSHPGEAAQVVDEVQSLGRESFPVGGDLGERRDVEAIAKQLGAHWDSLDALILNAGGYPRRAFRELTDEEFEHCFRINVFGPASLVRRTLPLLERSTSGRIVFVSSILAFTGSRHGAHYAASKAALLGLGRSLSRELAPKISVNIVAPGAVETGILSGDTKESRAARVKEIPLGRVAAATEVAEAIAFLASPKSSYLTGTTLHVNGGWRTD